MYKIDEPLAKLIKKRKVNYQCSQFAYTCSELWILSNTSDVVRNTLSIMHFHVFLCDKCLVSKRHYSTQKTAASWTEQPRKAEHAHMCLSNIYQLPRLPTCVLELCPVLEPSSITFWQFKGVTRWMPASTNKRRLFFQAASGQKSWCKGLKPGIFRVAGTYLDCVQGELLFFSKIRWCAQWRRQRLQKDNRHPDLSWGRSNTPILPQYKDPPYHIGTCSGN